MIYGTLLWPGAEAVHALMTSSTSFKLGSLRSNSVVGGIGLMRTLLSSSSCSLIGSLRVSWRKQSTSSVGHMRMSLCLFPSSCLVKPKEFLINTTCSLSLFPYSCNFALQRVISVFLKISRKLAIPGFSSSEADLFCFLGVWSSCHHFGDPSDHCINGLLSFSFLIVAFKQWPVRGISISHCWKHQFCSEYTLTAWILHSCKFSYHKQQSADTMQKINFAVLTALVIVTGVFVECITHGWGDILRLLSVYNSCPDWINICFSCY